MRNGVLPRSDLSLLKEQVLDHPPEAALPSNLSDYWLDLIGRDLDVCFGELDPERDGPTHMAVPLALVIHLVSGKQETRDIQIELEQFQDHLVTLRAEIALEQINRQTKTHINAATLETIFENRQVVCTNTSGPNTEAYASE